MFVSDRHRFVWVSVAKAMTTTMRVWLPEHFDGELVGGFHNRNVPGRAATYYTWAIVRNPYSRALSAWWHTTQDPTGERKYLKGGRYPVFDEPPSFEEFVEWMIAERGKFPITTPQADWLRQVRLDQVWQMEYLLRLRASVWVLWVLLPRLAVVGLPKRVPSADWPHELASGGEYPDWREYVTGHRAELVRRWAGEDFDRYGYAT